MGHERILVPGGAGFIGNAFVRHVLAHDADVSVLTFDLLTYAGHLENLEDLPDPERHAFLQGDIADPATVAGVFADFQPDAVVSFAAETHVDRSLLDPTPFVRTNVMGTQVLLTASREANARFVQVSTDEVYGSLPAPELATPDTPLRPTNPYAASKAASDLMVLAAWHSFDQDVMVTRCTNNYGPRQTPEKLVPLMILRACARGSLPIYGDGTHERDWIHVTDHVAGIRAALDHGTPGSVYQFAGTSPHANLHVVETICRLAGTPPDLITHVDDRPGHDRRYALDDAASRSALDWAPRIGFEDGLADTVAWYRNNPTWCLATASEDMRAFMERNYGHRT